MSVSLINQDTRALIQKAPTVMRDHIAKFLSPNDRRIAGEVLRSPLFNKAFQDGENKRNDILKKLEQSARRNPRTFEQTLYKTADLATEISYVYSTQLFANIAVLWSTVAIDSIENLVEIGTDYKASPRMVVAAKIAACFAILTAAGPSSLIPFVTGQCIGLAVGLGAAICNGVGIGFAKGILGGFGVPNGISATIGTTTGMFCASKIFSFAREKLFG